MTEQSTNTTDIAIEICKENISNHRKQSSRLLMFILGLTAIFVLSQVYSSYFNRIRISSVAYTIDETNKDLDNVSNYFEFTPTDTLKFNNDTSYRRKQRIVKMLSDSYAKVNSINNQMTELNNKTVELILYGIFILIFGVLTSFYRFHLKEISKYEHFLIGIHRVRLPQTILKRALIQK